MTLRDLNLVAGVAALATLGVVGCAESPEPEQGFEPSAAPSGYTAPVDPATATSPPTPALPDAPPEIPATEPSPSETDVPPANLPPSDVQGTPPG